MIRHIRARLASVSAPSAPSASIALLPLGLLAIGVVAPAGAQQVEPRCTQEALLQDACQTAADLFTFLTPQLGAALSGGSATLGQGGITGGLGRFALAFRVSGLRAEVPDLDASPSTIGAARQRTIPVHDQYVAVPQLDLSIGIFRGFPLGPSNVGGVDLLLSGVWIPGVEAGEVAVSTSGGGFRLGGGARLVLLQESFTTPGLSVTWMRRELPTTSVTARMDGGGDTVRVDALKLTADSWRVMASKTLYSFGIAAGIGQDRYGSSGDLGLVVREGGVEVRTERPIPYERAVRRTNAFVDLSVALRSSRLVFELGRVWGGSAETFNDFAGTSADAARFYGSAGLRVGF